MLQLLLALIFFVGGVFPVLAAELSVTLYPDAADVREELLLTPENNSIFKLLPDGVVRDSVRLQVEGAEVHSMYYRDVARVDSPRTKAAREAVEAAEKALAELDAELAVLATRIRLWQEPPVAFANEATLSAAVAAVATNLPPLFGEKAKLVQQRGEAAQEVQRRRNELNRVSGEFGDSGKDALTSVQLVAQLAPLPMGKPLASPVKVVLAYSLGNCGWTPEYRLEALTETKAVRVVRLAQVRQSSGRDWPNAALRLSTSQPAAHVNPMPVQGWRIASGGPELRKTPNQSAPKMAMSAAPMARESADAVSAPVYSEGAASMTWDLGQRSVNSGDELLLTLDTQLWKADFYRLLRPGQQNASWLMADVTPDAPQTLPPARARLLVDGVFMGDTHFAFSGKGDKKSDIAFGIDPAVSAEMVLDSNKSGDRGIIAKSQTRVWNWRITVRNDHTKPVAIRLEDAAPQSGDERIAVRVESSPAAVADENILRWAFTIPGNGKTDIAHQVSMSAPADLRVWTGR